MLAERSDTKSNIKLDGFRSRLQAFYVSSQRVLIERNSLSVDDIYVKNVFVVGSKEEKSTFFEMKISSKRFVLFKELFISFLRICFQLVAFVWEHKRQKAMWMGFLLRLELICEWFSGFVWVYAEVTPSFPFLKVCLFSLFLPLLIFDFWFVLKFFAVLLWIILCVCVCVCVCLFDMLYSLLVVCYWFCVCMCAC